MPGPLFVPPMMHVGLTTTFIGSNVGANQTAFNFGNFNAPRAGLMVVGTIGRDNLDRTVSSVSIGGTNGTIHVNPSGYSIPSAFASRVVTAGNQNVTVTLSGSALRCACWVWLLEDYLSATPVDTDGANNSTTSNSIAATLDVPADGVALVVHYHVPNEDTVWTNATQDAAVVFSSDQRGSGAHYYAGAAVTNLAMTASWTSSNNRGICAASWR